jgi:hypothetical protein
LVDQRRLDEAHDNLANTATLHEEPEAALPSTDGELDPEAPEAPSNYGNGVGNFGGSLAMHDPYTPQPWGENEDDNQRDGGEIYGDNITNAQGIGDMSATSGRAWLMAGLTDEGDDEDQKDGDQIFGDNIEDAGGMGGGGAAYQGSLQEPGEESTEDGLGSFADHESLDTDASLRPAWLDPAGVPPSEGGGGGGDFDIAAGAREFLAVKSFAPHEQQALINEGEDRAAANLASLDLTGTHYEQLEEAMAGADAIGEAVLWW